MKFGKKLLSGLLAGALMLSFAGCSSADTSWIIRSESTTVPAGVYLYNMMYAYMSAQYMVEDWEKDVLSQKIEDQDASQWITDTAMTDTKRALYTLDRFAQMGLTLSEEDKALVDATVEATYTPNEELMKKNGIGEESLKMLTEAQLMGNYIFETIYGEGGEKAISEEELRKEYDENYVKIGMLSFTMPTEGTVSEDATEEEKAQAEELYQQQLSAAKQEVDNWWVRAQAAQDAGKDFNDIINEYNAAAGNGEATDNFFITRKDNSSNIPALVMENLDTLEVGKVQKLEDENNVFIVMLKDANEDPQDFEDNRVSVMADLKYDEYTQEVEEAVAAASYEVNQASVDRYTPKKVRLQ